MKKRLVAVAMAVATLSALVLGMAPVSAQSQGTLDHILITPASATLTAGGTQQFSAQGYDASNAAIAGLSYTWGVVAGGGSINGTGFFTAGNVAGTFNNTVQVIATQGDVVRVAFATVNVTAAIGPLDHVVITPASATLTVGGTQQFSAQGYDAANVTIAGLSYTWGVVAGGGSINGTGFFTAGNVAGTFNNTVQVIATQGDIVRVAFATVNVTAAIGPLDHVVITPASATLTVGGTQQFSAQGYDAANVTIAGLSYTWGVVAGGGSINGTGFFTAGNVAGTFNNTVQVIATQGDVVRVGFATVNVTAAPVQPGPVIRLPPGLAKKGLFAAFEGRFLPPGWSKGKKTGWDKER